MHEKEFVFIGIDPTDPYAKHKRSVTRAILRDNLTCSFDEWEYQITGYGIVPEEISHLNYIVAIDGPQGLSGLPERISRESERQLGAAGKTGYNFPPSGRLYAGFIKGSVKLFYSLFKSGLFHLYGMPGIAREDTNLIEVYPGSAWKPLNGSPLRNKKTPEGRQVRYDLLLKKGLLFPAPYGLNKLPSHDQLDAALAAYIAYLFKQGKTEDYGEHPFEDKNSRVIREGFIIQPHM